MMSWADRQLCGFDIETTGEDQETARIVAVTLVLVGGGEPPKTYQYLVDSGEEIPADATALHRITTERVRREGLKPAKALRVVANRLDDAWGSDIPVIGFNVVYDLTVLDREMRRHLCAGLDSTGPVIDPHVIDRALDRRKGKRTLEETCRYYNVRHAEAHNATEDALAATRLAWRLAKRYPAEVGGLALTELHRRQVGWARQWAMRLNGYWRSQNQNKSIDGSWPLRPYPHVAETPRRRGAKSHSGPCEAQPGYAAARRAALAVATEFGDLRAGREGSLSGLGGTCCGQAGFRDGEREGKQAWLEQRANEIHRGTPRLTLERARAEAQSDLRRLERTLAGWG